MQVNIATFAEFIPRTTNYQTLVGLTKHYAAPMFPAPIGLHYFAQLEFEPSECGLVREFRLEITDQDGKEIFNSGPARAPINQDLSGMGGINVNLEMGVTFPRPGTYTASLWMGGDMIRDIRFMVTQQQVLVAKPNVG